MHPHALSRLLRPLTSLWDAFLLFRATDHTSRKCDRGVLLPPSESGRSLQSQIFAIHLFAINNSVVYCGYFVGDFCVFFVCFLANLNLIVVDDDVNCLAYDDHVYHCHDVFGDDENYSIGNCLVFAYLQLFVSLHLMSF